METPAAPERLGFVDGLRGLAALSVTLFHFFASSSLHAPLSAMVPRPLSFLLEHGSLGVQIFFVLSGFVIAYSLRRTTMTVRSAANFAFRRQVRLDPPYWVTIALLTLAHEAVVRSGGDGGPWPTFPGVVSHFFYAQDILGYPTMQMGFWTLCIEVQFYLVYIAVLAGVQQLESMGVSRSAARLVVFAPLGAASIWAYVTGSYGVSFVPHWSLFGLGVLACWTFEGAIRPAILGAYAVIVATALAWRFTPGPIVAIATAFAIHLAGAWGRMDRWLVGRVIQFFGRIWSCLYLLHVLVGNAALGLMRRATGATGAGAVACFGAAIVASVVAAYLLHVVVERPAVRLAKRLKVTPQPVRGSTLGESARP